MKAPDLDAYCHNHNQRMVYKSIMNDLFYNERVRNKRDVTESRKEIQIEQRLRSLQLDEGTTDNRAWKPFRLPDPHFGPI